MTEPEPSCWELEKGQENGRELDSAGCYRTWGVSPLSIALTTIITRKMYLIFKNTDN